MRAVQRVGSCKTRLFASFSTFYSISKTNRKLSAGRQGSGRSYLSTGGGSETGEADLFFKSHIYVRWI